MSGEYLVVVPDGDVCTFSAHDSLSAAAVERERVLTSGLAPFLAKRIYVRVVEVDGNDGLRGTELRKAIERVLSARRGEDLHYRDVFAAVEAEEGAVGGKDPVATLLTQLSRSTLVEAVGTRSGRYRVRQEGDV